MNSTPSRRGLWAAIALASCISLPGLSHAAPEWRPGVARTAYATLFEWSWDAVARECTQVLGPKGYAAVQVSPPQEHAPGSEWWRRYQPVSYQLVSRSGNRAQFQNMVNTCKAAGVDVYVDLVINHMADYFGGTGVGGSPWSARNFPAVPYGSQDFHTPKCDIASTDYNDTRSDVLNCDLPGLPDLHTGSSYVQGKIAAYMNDLLSLGVAGFRLDAAKHIAPADIAAIKARVPGSWFFTQEVIRDGTVGSASSGDLLAYQNLGTVNEFNYVYAMKHAFLGTEGFSLSRLPEMFSSWGFMPSDKATVFVNNHDTERKLCSSYAAGGVCDSLSTLNGNRLYLANVFMLAYSYGYPSVASGYYFSDHDMGPPAQQPWSTGESSPGNCSATLQVGRWDCVHRDRRVANMVGFRNYVQGTPVANWVSGDAQQVAFSRGNKGWLAINNSSSTWQRSFTTGLPDGTYCDVLASDQPEQGACTGGSVTVSAGQASLTLAPGQAVALHIGAPGDTLPPSPPAALSRGPSDASRITLQWNASTDSGTGVAGYRVFRNGVQIGSTTTLSFTDASVPPNTPLQYTVRAWDNAGNVSAASNALDMFASPGCSLLPPGPSGMKVISMSSSHVTLGWNAMQVCDPVSGLWNPVASYRVLRNGGQIGSSVVTSFTDSTVIGGTTYSYSYRAVDAAGNVSQASPPISVTPPKPNCVLPIPADLFTVNGVTQTSISLSWKPLYTCVGMLTVVFPVTEYDLMRNGVKIATVKGTSFTDTGLQAGTTYSYTLIGRDSAGVSTALSPARPVTTLPAGNMLTVYYKQGFASTCFHYAPQGGSWTSLPGLSMSPAEVPGYNKISVNLGSATSAQVAFNNCNGQWDSNGGKNYVFNSGTWNYDASRSTRIAAGVPVAASVTFQLSGSVPAGSSVYLVGDLPVLGSWNTGKAIALQPSGSGWSVTLNLPAATAMQYKYIRKDGNQTVTWEAGSNRLFTTPASGSVVRSDSWR